MSKQQRGLGKGLSALLGGDADLSNIRKPVGYVNKDVVTAAQTVQDTADILRIPMDMVGCLGAEGDERRDKLR